MVLLDYEGQNMYNLICCARHDNKPIQSDAV